MATIEPIKDDLADNEAGSADPTTITTPAPETTPVEVDKNNLCEKCEVKPRAEGKPFCAPCWDEMPLCGDCGKKTGRKGFFNKRTNRQHGTCQTCYAENQRRWEEHQANRRSQPKVTVVTPVPNFLGTVDQHNLLERIFLANEWVTTVADDPAHDDEIVEKIKATLRSAENHFDEDNLNSCDQSLRALSYEKSGVDLASAIATLDYEALDGWSFSLFNELVFQFEWQRYGQGFRILREIRGLLEYFDQMDEELEKKNRQFFAEIEALRTRKSNRTLREQFMTQRAQQAALQPKPAAAKAVVTEELKDCIKKCGRQSKFRLCQDCYHKVPQCPKCQTRRVHVANDGRDMANCFECHRAEENEREQRELDEAERHNAPKSIDPDKAQRERDRRDRQLARSVNPNKGSSGKKK